MPSKLATYNLYVVLADLYIDDENEHFEDSEYPATDNEKDDPETNIMHEVFDLVALEDKSERTPIFTQELLQRIASDTATILSEQSKPLNARSLSSVYYTQANGQSVKIWKPVPNSNAIITNYLTRVELCPGFRKEFGNAWKRSIALRGLNVDLMEAQRNQMDAPYFLESYQRALGTIHLDPAEMARYRSRLRHTKKLWEKTSSCATLCKAIKGGASQIKTPITKVACIGLGRLNLEPLWHESALQHLSIFSIAQILNGINRARDPNCAPVQIIAQEPCYEECDHILLQELTTSPIDFNLTDPETLLSIHASTLVVSAFLPWTVPLMQIVADLFDGEPEEGPAMILWDKVPGMNPAKRKYFMRDRDSPALLRFLDGYLGWMGEFGELEGELLDDVAGVGNEVKFWLGEMKLRLREGS